MIFCVVYFIKGGSGIFGFLEIVDFIYIIEILLDEVWDGICVLDVDVIELLFKFSDCLWYMV